uniref:Uncharacterized protein n=1 Tax=Mola mola TaxID=94237 RepID=A0A3Q3WSQ2_MOLML
MTEIKSWAFWRPVEYVDMLLFIFIGIAAIIGKDKIEEKVAQQLKVSLAFALAIATLAQTFGHVSGAHLNPAVTLGLLVSCQISTLRCVCYILVKSQSLKLIVIQNKPLQSNFTLRTAAVVHVLQLNKVTVGQGFTFEFLATLQLVLLGLGHFAAISFTGCGIYPARSFGPALLWFQVTRRDVLLNGPQDVAIMEISCLAVSQECPPSIDAHGPSHIPLYGLCSSHPGLIIE